MPISVACPQCSTTLRAPDNAAGRKVKCPKCGTPFDVPEAAPVPSSAPPVRGGRPPQEYDDEPAPRRRRREDGDEDYDDEPPLRRRQEGSGANENGAQFGLGIAALSVGAVGLVFAFIPFCGAIIAIPACVIGLILGVVGLIIGLSRNKQGLAFPIAGSAVSFVGILVAVVWWLWFVNAANQTAQGFKNAVEQAQRQQRNQGGNPFFNPGVGGRITFSANSQVTAADRFDRVRVQSRAKTFAVNLTAGKTYQIDMTSITIDPYLRLEDPDGKQVAQDDDSGGNLNARITYVCPRTGAYTVIATTFAAVPIFGRQPTGPFALTVRER